jgi:phospholipid/cholesterol/gamma-HCH transport system substrate-binding protein
MRLGAFLVLGLGLLIALVALVLGERLLQQRYTYYVDFEGVSVNGLRVGSSVLYNGIEVGTVSDTRFAEDSVEHVVATLLLEDDVPIKANVKARLFPVGITGNMQIELYGATDDADSLPPGSHIPATSSTLDLITEPVTNVANELLVLLNRVSSVFDDEGRADIAATLAHVSGILEENREPLNRILSNVDTLVSEETDSISDTLGRLNDTARRLSASAEALETAFTRTEGQPPGATLPELMVRISETLDKANESIGTMEGAVLTAEEDLQENLDLLTDTLEYLNIFAAKISENPSQLIR